MLLSEALKILIGAKDSVSNLDNEFAFRKIGEFIADEECNEHKMTLQEWECLVRNFKELAENTFENDAKYRLSLSRD